MGGGVVVVCYGFVFGYEFGVFVVEIVVVKVFGVVDGGFVGDGVVDEDGVVGIVDVGVDVEVEEMLVVVGVDVRVDLSVLVFGVFVFEYGVGV